MYEKNEAQTKKETTISPVAAVCNTEQETSPWECTPWVRKLSVLQMPFQAPRHVFHSHDLQTDYVNKKNRANHTHTQTFSRQYGNLTMAICNICRDNTWPTPSSWARCLWAIIAMQNAFSGNPYKLIIRCPQKKTKKHMNDASLLLSLFKNLPPETQQCFQKSLGRQGRQGPCDADRPKTSLLRCAFPAPH